MGREGRGLREGKMGANGERGEKRGITEGSWLEVRSDETKKRGRAEKDKAPGCGHTSAT